MVPGVGEEGVASDPAGAAGHDLKEDLLEKNDHDKEEKRPGGGEVHLGPMGGGNELADAVMGDEGPGDSKDKGPDNGGEGFGLPVSVGVIRVGGLGGVLEGSPDQ